MRYQDAAEDPSAPDRVVTIIPRMTLDFGPAATRPLADVPGAAALAFRAQRWSDIRDAAATLVGGAALAATYLVAVVPGLVLVVVIGTATIIRGGGNGTQ